MVNRQSVRRRGDLHQALRTTVFSPEDIGVVRGGPADRRRFLDETLAVVDPKAARAGEEVEQDPASTGRAPAHRRPPAARRRWPTPSTCGTPGSTRPAPPWSRPATAAGRRAGARWPRPTTRGWPARPTDVGLAVPAIVVRPAGRRPGRGPGQGRRTGRLDGRTPPGRAGAHRSRGCPAGPTPPKGSSGHWPWPCSWRPTSWPPIAWARPRYCCSTTCSPSSTRSGRGPCWPGCRRARPCSPRRFRPRPRWPPARVYTMSTREDPRPRGLGGPAGSRECLVTRPSEPGDGPRPLDASLDAVSRQLGMRDSRGLGRLFAHWPEIVGPAMADHVQPIRLDRECLGGDRGPPGLGHPGPPDGGPAPRPGGRRDRVGQARPGGGPGPAVTRDPHAATIGPEGHLWGLHWGLGIGGSRPSPERPQRTADDLVPPVPDQSIDVGKGAPVALKTEDRAPNVDEPPTTPRTSPFWRVSTRSGSGRGCTSDRPARPVCTTWCGRSWTTRWTRPWPATAPRST